jgi:hypothetical protein
MLRDVEEFAGHFYDCVEMTELIPDKPVSSRGAKIPKNLTGSEMLFSLSKCVPGPVAEAQISLAFPRIS